MSTLSLTRTWISSSGAAGGGVRGKDDGIAHITTTQVGAIIKAFHLFIPEYRRVGEMTIGNTVGEDINGIISECLSSKLCGTGRDGKIAGIGRSKITGVSRV
jgi:hypothetical protein